MEVAVYLLNCFQTLFHNLKSNPRMTIWAWRDSSKMKFEPGILPHSFRNIWLNNFFDSRQVKIDLKFG
jgi:hypothetical protein